MYVHRFGSTCTQTQRLFNADDSDSDSDDYDYDDNTSDDVERAPSRQASRGHKHRRTSTKSEKGLWRLNIHAHICSYIMYLHAHLCLYVRAYARMCGCAVMYVKVHVCVYIGTYVCVFVYVMRLSYTHLFV